MKTPPRQVRQRLVETALRQSELRYRAMVEQQGEAVCRWLPDTTLTFVNDEYCRFFGKDRGQLLGLKWLKLVPASQRGKVTARYADLARHPKVYQYEHTVIGGDGRSYWLSWKDVPLLDDRGRLFEFQSIGHDITARKQYEETLERKEEILKALLNNIPDIAWLKDERSRYVAANEPFAKACNRTTESIVGKTDLDLWPRPLAQLYRRDDRRVVRSRKQIRTEEPLVDHEGRTIWIDTVKTPVFDRQGRAVGSVGIARDITDKKSLVEQLKQSEIALRRALAMKDALSRDLHDRVIQSLYAVGLGLEECVHPSSVDIAHCRKKLQGCVDILNDSIRELRAFIVDARRDESLLLAGDLYHDIRQFVARLRAMQSVPVTCRLSRTVCRRIDAQRARHVLSVIREAVSNSLRHARAKSIRIGVDRFRGQLRVQVQDDGVGLRHGKKKRCGIGLKNIYARVADMAGCLMLESTAGKGTMLRILLKDTSVKK